MDHKISGERGGSYTRLPELRSLAHELGIELAFDDEEAVVIDGQAYVVEPTMAEQCGNVLNVNGHILALVSKGLTPRRMRHVLADRIVRVLLGHADWGYTHPEFGSAQWFAAEIGVDEIVGEFLMPRHFIRPRGNLLKQAEGLATIFNVEKRYAHTRLLRLDPKQEWYYPFDGLVRPATPRAPSLKPTAVRTIRSDTRRQQSHPDFASIICITE